MYIYLLECTIAHPFVHCSMSSAPLGVQFSLTSSLGEYPDFRTGSGILGFRPRWCPSPFPSPSISRCFSIHFSSPAIEFHSCFFFTTDVFAPIGRPFTYFFGDFQGLGLALVPDIAVPEAEQGAHAPEYTYNTVYIYKQYACIYINLV